MIKLQGIHSDFTIGIFIISMKAKWKTLLFYFLQF